MKFGIVVANVNMASRQLEERKRFLERYASSDTEIVMLKNEEGPVSIESEFEHEEAGVQIVRTIMALQEKGFDAFIPCHVAGTPLSSFTHGWSIFSSADLTFSYFELSRGNNPIPFVSTVVLIRLLKLSRSLIIRSTISGKAG